MKKQNTSCNMCGYPGLTYPMSGVFPSGMHIVDGVNISAEAGICIDCYKKATIGQHLYYCVSCQAFYKAPANWSNLPSRIHVICPKHSLKSKTPTVACEVCDVKLSQMNDPASVNSKGHHYCPDHAIERIGCSAQYCGAMIHPNEPGIETSPEGYKIYCGPCSLAKTIPPEAPPGYHPYTWDYKNTCACAVCCYLRGRGPKWPNTASTSLHGMHICAGCGGPHCKDCNGDNPYCHICSKGALLTCKACDKPFPKDQYQGASYFSKCKSCMDSEGYWFCDVQCKGWFEPDTECSCGGVWPYNYKPQFFEFLTASNQAVSQDHTLFLGLELEVEAQKPGTSRAKGAKISRDLFGPYSYIVHDGSLAGKSGSQGPGTGGEHGFEIVTHPFTFEWFNEHYSEFCRLLDTLSHAGYRSWEGGRCGLHIHVSRAPMTQAHQMKFIRFIYGAPDLAMCIGQRDTTDEGLMKHAPFDKEDRSKFIQKVRNGVNPGVPTHHVALNSKSSATLEARWFRGTLNPESLRKSVEFMHSLWYFTKDFGFKTTNERNYLDWLRSTPQSRRYSTALNYIEQNYVTRSDR